jgi:nucleotide-binding universal stress UspA family protein
MTNVKTQRRPARQGSPQHQVVTAGEAWRPPTPVLLATDGSPAAAAAIRFARRMAERGSWTPEAVTVLEPLPAALPDMTMGVVSTYEPVVTEGIVGRIRAQLKRTGLATWDLTVQFGRVAPTIVRRARERGSTLIVLGLGEHGRIARLFGAETASRVCRTSDVPVLAVSAQTRDVPHTVLAAVDFGTSSVRAAHEALALLGTPGRLHLVHVCASMGSPTGHDLDWERTYEAGVRHGFDRLTKELARAGVTVTTSIKHGNVIEAIRAEADAIKADLISVGSHSQTVIDRLLIGFTAAELLRSAKCSVLVAPPASES